MLRKFLVFILFLLIAAGAYFVYAKTKEDKIAPDRDISESSDFEKQSVGLALKSFILNQGEHGVTLWRLNATAGNFTQEDEIFKIEKPKLLYFMPPDDEELVVVSEKGDIEQKSQLLRFIGSVNATHSRGKMHGELLIYNGTEKTMSFPEGGNFVGDSLWGNADIVIWHINSKSIEGIGHVDTHFSSDSKKLKKKDKIKPQKVINE